MPIIINSLRINNSEISKDLFSKTKKKRLKFQELNTYMWQRQHMGYDTFLYSLYLYNIYLIFVTIVSH